VTYDLAIEREKLPFCVPSEAVAYRDSLAVPAGTGDSAAK
jgi:hypothetical protein